ncbi:MAG: hypothetical protein COV99_11650 [Bacteroidetes bacterium CG12_big_fil_rev_8_21_14_0_65_60_17]|nr:MAG: hypothetical protein COV99_11650 [Bacteroidetes bacterium CG12_big_fil_rev_8_21_14_0_65_60_17]
MSCTNFKRLTKIVFLLLIGGGVLTGCDSSAPANDAEVDVESIVPASEWEEVLRPATDALGKGSVSDAAFERRVTKMYAVALRDLQKMEKQVNRFRRRNPGASDKQGIAFMRRLTRANERLYVNIADALAQLARDYPELDDMHQTDVLRLIDTVLSNAPVNPAPLGKEQPCYEECNLAYERAQAEIDRTVYLRTIECTMLSAEAALISAYSGNLIYAAGAGFLAGTTCSWFGWMEVDLMQQDASQALADCRMACFIQELNWWE